MSNSYISKCYRNGFKASKPKMKKDITVWRFNATNKTMLLVLLEHIFWYIWDRRPHKRKTETAHKCSTLSCICSKLVLWSIIYIPFPWTECRPCSFPNTAIFHDRQKKKLLSSALKKWDFNLICKGLIQLNMRFSLLYPENLRAYFEDRSKLFEFLQGAVYFLMLCPGIKMKIDLEIFFFPLSDSKSKHYYCWV